MIEFPTKRCLVLVLLCVFIGLTLPRNRCVLGSPTGEPTFRPTPSPTDAPTSEPSEEPSQTTNEPTFRPSPAPTDAPTNQPTVEPTFRPSPAPTDAPTNVPTDDPTFRPSPAPTDAPTSLPSGQPTDDPTYRPSPSPTDAPTSEPTDNPTDAPTSQPTDNPTEKPSPSPTDAPTSEPTDNPTERPSPSPTDAPTNEPSREPTNDPTKEPSDDPTVNPSSPPTNAPTKEPSNAPSSYPTMSPSLTPSDAPSDAPTASPTIASLRVYNISFQFDNESNLSSTNVDNVEFYIRIYGCYQEWTEWKAINIDNNVEYNMKNMEWNNVGIFIEAIQIISYNKNDFRFKCFRVNNDQLCLTNGITISPNSSQECSFAQISFNDSSVYNSDEIDCQFKLNNQTTTTMGNDIGDGASSGASTINDATISGLASVVIYGIPIVVTTLILLLIVNSVYLRYKKKGRYDINYKSILSFLVNTIDFWTNGITLFVYYDIISSNEVLFTVSITFLLFGYLLSMSVGPMYFVYGRWKTQLSKNDNDINEKYSKWMTQYQAQLFVIGILSGSFYNGIEFCSTKLFSYGLFFLPLKQSEFNTMLNVKVITMVLFAIIPQLSMQFYYFTSVDSDLVTSKDNEIVLVSCIFTILSTIIECFATMVRLATGSKDIDDVATLTIEMADNTTSQTEIVSNTNNTNEGMAAPSETGTNKE